MAPVERVEPLEYPIRAVAAQATLLWLLVLILLAVAGWVFDRNQHAAVTAMVAAREWALVDRGAGIVAVELKLPLADLPYLTDLPALRGWLADTSPVAVDRIRDNFLTLARHRDGYAKIRLFSPQGMELVRVNWQEGEAELVPRERLQDKVNRYFVQAGLAQPSRTIHVSRFDLNVENGAIERPFRPMLRFGTPVLSPDGELRGLVTINYLGQRLLDRLAALAPQASGSGLWLVDPEGHWLLGEHPDEAWGFTPSQHAGPRFQDRYPTAWAQFARAEGNDMGQAMFLDDLFTWRLVRPPEPVSRWILTGPGAAGWLLVSRVPAGALAAVFADQRRLLVRGLAALAAGALLATVAVAHYRVRRRQEAAAVRAGQMQFRGLLESAPDAVVIVDDRGLIQLVNAQVEDWFGYRREELLGQPVELLVPERLRAQHRQHREGYQAAPAVRTMGAGLELAAWCKDGSELPVEISLSPVETLEGNLVIAIIRDVSERRRLERAREAAQARYRELVDNLPVGVYRSSLSEPRRFLEVNPELVALFKAGSAEELLAVHPGRLYCDESVRAEVIEQLKRTGVVTARELVMVTLRGQEFDAALSAVIRTDVAGNQYVDGVIEDISARKRSEREVERLHDTLRQHAAALEAANRELEAFSYSVSHDLRAPLRAVDGFSRILLDEYAAALDDRGRGYLGRVRAAAQHMAALIDDLLKLARVSRTDLKPEPVDMSALAEDLVAELRRRDPERAINFRIQPDIRVLGDVRLLRVALDNLLGNAWKFTGPRPDAEVEFGADAGPDGPVYHVRDNGVGFDMDYADKLFGAFQRLHDAGEFPGTGIGLATVQRVIHKHGGRIWAHARIGAGATFYFTLGDAEET
jgi:PAS domain S-box-containing protein